MDHLAQLGDTISIAIKPDDGGLTGRECPQADCEGYFKIEFGTGLKGEGLPCHCPYCGHTAGHDTFWTKEQLEYAKSVAFRKIADAFTKDLKKLEFQHRPRGPFGIGMSMKLKPGPPVPIRYYRERQLETELVCANCTLRYSVYGVFAFCPDCGQHNSLQILSKNLELVEKMLTLANGSETDVAERLTENALEDGISAFDGFARELCRVHAKTATERSRGERLSFQNLDGARKNVLDLFGFDMAVGLAPDEWRTATIAFQKRHLLAHKMGVVDEGYVAKTGDAQAVVGRKAGIDAQEVKGLLRALGGLAERLSEGLQGAARIP
jgi:hypothetical protein